MLAKNSSTEYFIVSNRRQRLWKVSRLSWYVEHFNRDAIFHLSRALADDAWRSSNYCKDFFSPIQLFQRKRQKRPVIIQKRKQMPDYPWSDFHPIRWLDCYMWTYTHYAPVTPESITSLFWCLFLTSWRSCSCLSEFLLSRTNLSNVIEMPKSHLSNADFLFL